MHSNSLLHLNQARFQVRRLSAAQERGDSFAFHKCCPRPQQAAQQFAEPKAPVVRLQKSSQWFLRPRRNGAPGHHRAGAGVGCSATRVGASANRPRPNPSFERTHKGRPRYSASSLSLPRGLPLRSAQFKR